MMGIDQTADTSYVNTQLETKANSSALSNYYLKTETDTKLSSKADQEIPKQNHKLIQLFQN